MAYVAAIVHSLKLNLLNRLVGTSQSLFKGCGRRSDPQNPSAGW